MMRVQPQHPAGSAGQAVPAAELGLVVGHGLWWTVTGGHRGHTGPIEPLIVAAVWPGLGKTAFLATGEGGSSAAGMKYVVPLASFPTDIRRSQKRTLCPVSPCTEITAVSNGRGLQEVFGNSLLRVFLRR